MGNNFKFINCDCKFINLDKTVINDYVTTTKSLP